MLPCERFTYTKELSPPCGLLRVLPLGIQKRCLRERLVFPDAKRGYMRPGSPSQLITELRLQPVSSHSPSCALGSHKWSEILAITLIKLSGGLGETYRPEVPVSDIETFLRETNKVESMGVQVKFKGLKPITSSRPIQKIGFKDCLRGQRQDPYKLLSVYVHLENLCSFVIVTISYHQILKSLWRQEIPVDWHTETSVTKYRKQNIRFKQEVIFSLDLQEEMEGRKLGKAQCLLLNHRHSEGSSVFFFK